MIITDYMIHFDEFTLLTTCFVFIYFLFCLTPDVSEQDDVSTVVKERVCVVNRLVVLVIFVSSPRG